MGKWKNQLMCLGLIGMLAITAGCSGGTVSASVSEH